MAYKETKRSLLLRLQAKDPAAWREIDAVYRPTLIAYLKNHGLKESEAADAVQDTFVKLLGWIESSDLPKSDIGTWLFRLAHETLIDHARRRATDRMAVAGWVAALLRANPGDQLRMAELRRIARAVKKPTAGAASSSEETTRDETGSEGDRQRVGQVPASISRLARVS
jgi:DNA-directed RNA polymerase specialized sigma24 family protein